MLRDVSEDVRIRVKDGLRELRSIVREHRHDHVSQYSAKDQPVRGVEDIIGHAVSAFDDVMKLAQNLAPVRGHAIAAPGAKPLHSYFRARGNDEIDGARAFRRDLYRLAKLTLEQKKLTGFRIREVDFAAVHDALGRNEARRIAQLHVDLDGAAKKEVVAALVAALFLLLVRKRPITLPLPSGIDAAETDPAARAVISNVLASISIACGLATLDMEGASGSELMEIAVLAVDVRADRIAAAMDKETSQAELTVLFENLLTHLN